MNKFGHSLSSHRKPVQIIRSQTGLPFTSHGDYNIENRRLCNLGMPKDENDASNKKYVDEQVLAINNMITATDEKHTQLLSTHQNQLNDELQLTKEAISTIIESVHRELMQKLETDIANLESKLSRTRHVTLPNVNSD